MDLPAPGLDADLQSKDRSHANCYAPSDFTDERISAAILLACWAMIHVTQERLSDGLISLVCVVITSTRQTLITIRNE